MSRHSLIDSIISSPNPQVVRADWRNALVDIGSAEEGALESFLSRHSDLMALAGLARGEAVREELRGPLRHQLFLGCMSATETYFRDAVAVLVRVCAGVRTRFAGEKVLFSAINYYPNEVIGYALLESDSMANSEKIGDLLYRKFGVPKVAGSPLAVQLKEFENACQVRHSLTHAHGLVSGTGADRLGAGAARVQVELDSAMLEDAASVCRDLVLISNDEIMKSVLWSMALEGSLTGRKSDDRLVVETLFENFFHSSTASVGSWRQLHDEVKKVLRSLHA